MSDSEDFEETPKKHVLNEAQKEAFDVEEFVAWAEKDPRMQDFLRSIEKELFPDALSEAGKVLEKERTFNKEVELKKQKNLPSRLATKEDVERAAANFKTLFDNFHK